MERVDIYNLNEVRIKLGCDRSIARELSEYFSFLVPGHTFIPEVRARMWDGKIRLFNLNNYTIYKGLLNQVKKFCKDRDYDCVVHDGLEITEDVSINDLEDYFKDLSPTPRDYQIGAVAHAIRNHRAVIESSTGSGKSLIIYMLVKHYLDSYNGKILIIVPTTSLCIQMVKDFEGYGYTEPCHIIMSGTEKDNNESRVYVSTWQSAIKQSKHWFSKFTVVMCDEVHLAKAKSITQIMERLTECKYRFGFTGTLNESNCDKSVIEGLFGTPMKVSNTKDLIESNILSDFRIKCLVLKYPEHISKEQKKSSYQNEMDFITTNEFRNRFIRNLALTREGNTLILFQYVEKHGKVLYNLLLDSVKEGRKVFFVHGGVDAIERDDIRSIVENETNAIIVASYQTFSTGMNLKNLHNVIFSSPSKSMIRILQSIGRVLRKHESKDIATLYDISDDLQHKSYVNHTLKHFASRVKIYNEQEFKYKLYKIGLKYD